MLKPYPYPHEVAIAAILKNEAPYVKEWLDYHIAAGVTKFYLYDNDSTDNLTDVLKPYIDSGTVEYTWWPGKFMQFPAYNDAIDRHRFDCRYMAMIDLDEFIYPLGEQNIPMLVQEIFALDKKIGGYVVNWRVFGSSGYEHKDLSRGVLERFTQRGRDEFEGNSHVKSIVNPRNVDIFANPHFADYYYGKYAVNEVGTVVRQAWNPQLSGKKAVINHYLTKSREEYSDKYKRGRADWPERRPWKDFDTNDVNDVLDNGIVEYRKKMAAQPIPRRPTPGDVADILTYDFHNLSAVDTVCHLDDILAYEHFCRTELPDCTESERQTNYCNELVMKALITAFTTQQEIWQLRLFLDSAPEMLAAHRKIVTHLIKKTAPPMRKFYIGKMQWRLCKELDMLQKL